MKPRREGMRREGMHLKGTRREGMRLKGTHWKETRLKGMRPEGRAGKMQSERNAAG